LVAVIVPILGAGPVTADPISDKKAQAAKIAAALRAEGDRVEQLSEQLDQARLRSDTVAQKLADAEAKMAATDAQAATVRRALSDQAVSAYVTAGEPTTSLKNTNDLVVQKVYADALAGRQVDALDAVRQLRQQLAEERANLQDARKAANDALSKVTADERAAASASAASAAQLSKIKGDLALLVAQEAERQAAAEAAKVKADMAARQSRQQASRNRSGSSAPAPPPGEGAGAAVAEAQRQIGKPYKYGGSGPDSFDCSGLTAWAWRAGGRSLPHSSSAQWSATSRVPIDQLQPGDLVFFGSDLHHVGIYTGGGQMIEAPHTGTNVRYASIYRSDLVGGGRVN
jgi:peptidoglycan DL-endopeptidase CwlO